MRYMVGATGMVGPNITDLAKDSILGSSDNQFAVKMNNRVTQLGRLTGQNQVDVVTQLLQWQD
jgi:hypothetical protein